MKKIIYGILATVSGLVLLFSYRTSVGQSLPTDLAPAAGSTTVAPGTSASGTPAAQTPSASGSPSPLPSASASAPSGTTGSTTASGSGLRDGTFTGVIANTRYGGVSVQITVSGGVISAVQVPEYPSGDSRDRQINDRAIPQLISETLSAQSARIDMVSGATYTSKGYAQSLQSALDQAAA